MRPGNEEALQAGQQRGHGAEELFVGAMKPRSYLLDWAGQLKCGNGPGITTDLGFAGSNKMPGSSIINQAGQLCIGIPHRNLQKTIILLFCIFLRTNSKNKTIILR
ncbi:hypothetical protein Droror1_Dr00014699 [Drosera rotundifolia]